MQGLQAAAEIVAEKVGGDEVEPVAQMPLFPAQAIGDLPAGTIERIEMLRGRGRPPGARNRKTMAMVEYIERRYTHPAQVLAETWSRPVGDLADELGCSRLEAYQIQQAAAREMLPYMLGKKPQAVDLNVNLPTIVLADPAQFAQMAQAAIDMSKIEFDQGVSEDDA